MRIEPRLSHPQASALPSEIEGFDALAELALDLRWTWSHATDKIWRALDPFLWEFTQNPWVVLQTVSRDKLKQVLSEAPFRTLVGELLEEKRKASEEPAWFQQNHAQAPIRHIAYFSMEFMLSEALPIYSGGLGNVAGDQLKAASDLGVPVVGIGLLYQRGYFRQVIDKQGAQQALFPYNDPGQLPVMPLRHPSGEWLRIEIALPGYSLWLRAWQVQVGRTKLYLLDSNDAANLPVHRGITSELYDSNPEVRITQEILLGIGGWRLLTALGIRPDVCHLNEGHTAFAVLERARQYMFRTGQDFQTALDVTRAGNLFTTHTAVAAGFDRFAPALVEKYLAGYAEHDLRINCRDLLALGRQDPQNANESFNMAYLAIRGSGAVNAVSRLHGHVSRQLFAPLFPRWPRQEIPIGHVTNGVHMPTWDSAAADELWTNVCGKERWLGPTNKLEHQIRAIPDETLWSFRANCRLSLVEFVRQRLSGQLAVAGASSSEISSSKNILDPDVLTLGFARRFAAYKRPNLLLYDPARLLRILNHEQRPVQLVMAGKAHPADKAGQALIEQWTRFIRQPETRGRVIFLSDSDMHLTEHLVQGVDLWINTPRRPWEACGTSGMKVLVNGGLNLSVLDGWWEEAYTPEVGWALGQPLQDPSDGYEAESLYQRLENEIIPEFYARDLKGLPRAWIQRIRESMASLTPHFCANRTVREYTRNHYLPAAAAYHWRSAENSLEASYLIQWRQTVAHHWDHITFGEMTVTSVGQQHNFEISVHLHQLPLHAVRVELYADGLDAPERHTMTCRRPSTAPTGIFLFTASVTTSRPVQDYTARIIPHHPGAVIPLEETHILWQR